MSGEPTPIPASAAHLGPEQPSGPFLGDDHLEMAIEATRQALIGAKTRPMRVELQEQMRRLIAARSPWQIARLEREKGLR